jgi:GDP-L-fucose synthase
MNDIQGINNQDMNDIQGINNQDMNDQVIKDQYVRGGHVEIECEIQKNKNEIEKASCLVCCEMYSSKLRKIIECPKNTSNVIMVTGGTGLVGKAIEYSVREENNSNDKWIFLSSKDCDFRSSTETEDLFNRIKPTHVIHLAAFVGGLYKNMRCNADFLRDNLLINDNVLFNSHKHNVVRLVSCLSTCIFPDKTSYPIDETMLNNGPPHKSNYGYAYAKRLIAAQNMAYNEQYGHHFTSVIPTNVFGPNDNYNIEDSHVIPGLIHKCMLAVENKTPLVISGTGSPLRQFIYSRDLARLIIWTLHEYPEIDPIILSVGADEEISIKTVATAIAKEFGLSDLKFDPTKADGQHKKTACNDKLRKYLPDFKFTPFEVAIKESVDWFKQNYKTARK